MKNRKQFVAYYYCNGFDHISLGLHICWSLPNIEIHLPFGFIRIGWVPCTSVRMVREFGDNQGYRFLYRSFGLSE